MISNKHAIKYLFDENPASDDLIAQARRNEVYYTSDRQAGQEPGVIELTFRANSEAILADHTSPLGRWIEALPGIIKLGFDKGSYEATPATLIKANGIPPKDVGTDGALRPVQFYERTVTIRFEA